MIPDLIGFDEINASETAKIAGFDVVFKPYLCRKSPENACFLVIRQQKIDEKTLELTLSPFKTEVK